MALALVALYGAISSPLGAKTLEGRVVRVADGDTITILDRYKRQHKIRLYGIDAPELHQSFGRKSRQNLERLVAGRDVRVDVIDIDEYGRNVGLVKNGGVIANQQMVRDGLAWVYRYFCKQNFCRDWERLEQAARRARKGLWSEKNPTPPWKWRRAERREHKQRRMEMPH